MNVAKPRRKPTGKGKKSSRPLSPPKNLAQAELHRLQNKLDETNEQMASRMGVSITTYNGWKYGHRPIPVIAQKLIALLLQQK